MIWLHHVKNVTETLLYTGGKSQGNWKSIVIDSMGWEWVRMGMDWEWVGNGLGMGWELVDWLIGWSAGGATCPAMRIMYQELSRNYIIFIY